MLIIIALLAMTSAPFSASQTPSSYSALVKQKEAIFSLAVPARERWTWRRPQTRDNAQEYRMDVSITNEGREFTFGFYLWKRAGSVPGGGDLESLIGTGQATVFERSQPRRMTIVRDAGIKLKLDGQILKIAIRGRDNVKRLFSGRPAQATFKITLPDAEPIIQTIPIVYQD